MVAVMAEAPQPSQFNGYGDGRGKRARDILTSIVAVVGLVLSIGNYLHDRSRDHARLQISPEAVIVDSCPRHNYVAISVTNVGFRTVSVSDLQFVQQDGSLRSQHRIALRDRIGASPTFKTETDSAGLPLALDPGRTTTFNYRAAPLRAQHFKRAVLTRADGKEIRFSIADQLLQLSLSDTGPTDKCR